LQDQIDRKAIAMKNTIKLLTGAALIAGVLAAPVMSSPASAQGKPQTVALVRVDPASVAKGYRTSKVVGSSVVNEDKQTVGTIDDLLVTPSEKVPFAVLSVGGFLGLGTKYVVVPFSSLEIQEKSIMLRGATKESLKSLPEFKYNS
jgi:hypothetical protein